MSTYSNRLQLALQNLS